MEAEWRSSYGNALAEATSRYEAAEAALAQVRIRTKDGGRTQQDLASTRAALAAREKELPICGRNSCRSRVKVLTACRRRKRLSLRSRSLRSRRASSQP